MAKIVEKDDISYSQLQVVPVELASHPDLHHVPVASMGEGKEHVLSPLQPRARPNIFQRRRFWIVLVILIVIIATIGGAVGESLARKSQGSNGASSPGTVR